MSQSAVPSESVTTKGASSQFLNCFHCLDSKNVLGDMKMLCTATDSRGLGKFLDSAYMKLGNAISPQLCVFVICVSG